MELFDKKFVHFMWSNELAGKKCFVSYFINDLESMVNSKDKSYLDTVVFSEDKANPFRATTGKYSFAYYDPNYECKLAYRKGKQIQYRVGDTWLDCVPDWNEDYEYRVKPEKRRMSNRELAKWLSEGKGQLQLRSGAKTTFYSYCGEDNAIIKEGWKLREWESDEWHEPEVED